MEKPIADALGAGLDVMDATGRLIVNIGADTTEISLISLGGIVQSRLLKIGGTKFDEAIQQTVKKKHNLVIGMKSAERLKMQLASGIKEDEEITYDVMGRNLITGLPNKVTVTNHLIQQETGLSIMKMEEPELTVVKGLGMIMENPDYERLAHNLQDSDFH